ncbi:hypothetical protein QQ045_015070 [Rhodiola kirilowii]
MSTYWSTSLGQALVLRYYMQNYEVDWSFMTTMVERWRSEMHTFHLRYAEMTITLEDVGVLTGLPIKGRAVTTNQEVDDALCMQLLGVVPPQGRRYTSIRCTWFKDNMSELPVDVTDEVVQRYGRAYILVMLESSLLPDSLGSDVSLLYLPLQADLNAILGYSRGAAVLAYLYRMLCNACESTHTQLSGCAILVQLSDIDPMRLPALGYKWSVPRSWMQTSHHVLMLYRDLLDRQESNDVIWTHYTDDVLGTLNPIWRQPELALSPQSHRDMHMSKIRTFEPIDAYMQVYMSLWENCAERLVTGESGTDGSYLDAYYTWYYNVTGEYTGAISSIWISA